MSNIEQETIRVEFFLSVPESAYINMAQKRCELLGGRKIETAEILRGALHEHMERRGERLVWKGDPSTGTILCELLDSPSTGPVDQNSGESPDDRQPDLSEASDAGPYGPDPYGFTNASPVPRSPKLADNVVFFPGTRREFYGLQR